MSEFNPDAAAAVAALIVLCDKGSPFVDWTLAYECDRCKVMSRIYDEEDAKRAVERKGMCGECAR